MASVGVVIVWACACLAFIRYYHWWVSCSTSLQCKKILTCWQHQATSSISRGRENIPGPALLRDGFNRLSRLPLSQSRATPSGLHRPSWLSFCPYCRQWSLPMERFSPVTVSLILLDCKQGCSIQYLRPILKLFSSRSWCSSRSGYCWKLFEGLGGRWSTFQILKELLRRYEIFTTYV